jgi:two-component system, chemotaxis family, protein-glutamate methylesterase/glutaminase
MKILLVDDSALMRGILREVLGQEADITIAGEAANGKKAIELTREFKPDLVIMDVNMPVMDGIEATKQIMKLVPTPVLVFTAAAEAERGFEAIESGAIEILRKPPIDQLNEPAFYRMFMETIRTLAGQRPRGLSSKEDTRGGAGEGTRREFSLVVIGASTGGPVVVRQLLGSVPAEFPLPIAVAQHLEEGFDGGYADWLNEGSRIAVRLARGSGVLEPGTAVVAPADYHLRCTRGGYSLDQGEKLLNQRPSVNILFSSAAEIHGPKTLGILLTGMGRDGAEGCVAIKANGGMTLCQDEKSSAIFGMPKAAIELKGASRVLSIDEIANYLRNLSR